MSHGWRSVLLGRDLLLQNLGWLVGNGESINIWDDPWLSLTSQERPMGPPNEAHVKLSVADLIDHTTKDWDVAKIQLLLPAYENSITSIKPSLTGTPDKLVWLGTKSGEYTTKSGYYTAVNKEDNMAGVAIAGGFKWKNSVWNLPCAPKVKLFSWKLLRGAIPVGERLVERQVPIDPLCKRCSCSESIVHLLFHCRFAQRVWHLAPLATTLDVSRTIDLMSSWDSLCALKCLPPAGITTGSLVPWILWSLWKARNNFVFEGHSASPEETLSTAIRLAREWGVEVKKDDNLGSRQTPLEIVPPCPGSLVVRTDAAWSSEANEAGLGWVIFSNAGNSSFKKPVNRVATPLMAEGLALREAVQTCVTLGVKAVTFQSDSSQLIKAVTGGVTTIELYSVVADIHSFVSVFDSVSFSWIPRERNVIADALAKAALIVAGTLVVEDAFIAPN